MPLILFFENENILCFELIDSAKNIFERLEFTDDQDRLLHVPKSYLEKHKKDFLYEIKEDYKYFHGVYKKVMDSVSLENKALEDVIQEVILRYDLNGN